MANKKVDTVVDDIYETLSCLCDSEELVISDEQVEEFGERIKKALKSWALLIKKEPVYECLS